GRADRDPRFGPCTPRLEDPPGLGARPRRQATPLPTRREPVAAPGRGGHGAPVAVRRAAVALARRRAGAAGRGRAGEEGGVSADRLPQWPWPTRRNWTRSSPSSTAPTCVTSTA